MSLSFLVQGLLVTGTFKIRKSTNGQYYWSLIASNGKTLCHSETYTTKQSAQNGIESCKLNSTNARIVDES